MKKTEVDIGLLEFGNPAKVKVSWMGKNKDIPCITAVVLVKGYETTYRIADYELVELIKELEKLKDEKDRT